MKLRLMSSTFLIVFTAFLTACAPKSATLNAVHESFAADPEAKPEKLIVKKVRVRDADGTKVFEYLVPNSNPETWTQFGEIETLAAGTQLHHWGPKEDVANWAKNGIKAADITRAVRTRDESDLVGGGFYMSKDTVDSSSYGSNLLIAEPKHDVLVLANTGITYDRDHLAIYDFGTENILVPVPLIAGAGIEAIRYTDTWMVVIRGSVLENLFEGSWENFRHRFPDADFMTLVQFAAKYPPQTNIADDAGLRESQPLFVKSFLGEPVTDAELAPIAKTIIDGVSRGTITGDSFKSPALKKFVDSLRPYVMAAVETTRTEMEKDSASISKFSSLLRAFHIPLAEAAPGYFDAIDPGFAKLDLQIPETGVSTKMSPERMSFVYALPFLDYYRALNRLLGPDRQKAVSEAADLGARYMKLGSLLWNFADGESTLNNIALMWTDGKPEFRTQPLIASGSVVLDGKGSIGYIEITEKQKEFLESNPYILPTFASRTAADGTLHYFVHYEYPSAINYRRLKIKLNTDRHPKHADLAKRLEEAEQSGKLTTDPQLAEQLTAELTKALAVELIDSGDAESSFRRTSYMRAIQPFADKRMNEKALQVFAAVQSGPAFLLDSSLKQVITPLELDMTARASGDLLGMLCRSLDPSKQVVDLDVDIGFWELAANRPGPHKDPAAFLAAVKDRFLKPDVQAWVEEGDGRKVLETLRAAGDQ